jgi:predicted outer membrane protein
VAQALPPGLNLYDGGHRMKMHHTWIVLAAMAATSVSVAAQATGSGIKVTKDRGTGTSTTNLTTTKTTTTTVITGGDVLPALPAFSLSSYPTLTLSNIAAHLLNGDSAEIRMARLAESKATAQAVHDYATMLANDHTAHYTSAKKALDDENVVPAPLAYDVEATRMDREMTRLINMPAGTAWDAEFIRFQVQHHQNEIDLLSANTTSVHGHEMHELLEDTIAALGKHRDAGRSTATTVGITLY